MRIRGEVDLVKLEKYFDNIEEAIKIDLANQVYPHIEFVMETLQHVSEPNDPDPNVFETGWLGISWKLGFESEGRNTPAYPPTKSYSSASLKSDQFKDLIYAVEKLTLKGRDRWINGEAIYIYNPLDYTGDQDQVLDTLEVMEVYLQTKLGI